MLKRFVRIPLKPGETRTARFELPVSELAYYDEKQKKFVTEAIEYGIFAGRHSLDPDALKARFTVR